MKRKFLTALLMSVMALACSAVVNAEDVLETNTEDVISNIENEGDNPISLYSDNITISEDIFPDEKFRQYMIDTFDKDRDGYFSQEEIESITSIDVSGNRVIKSLAGINYFTNLESLACSGNQLVELDVSQNPNLRTLYCENNKIAELDISQNPNLQTIYCSYNQLTELYVSQNANLSTLHCNGNQITALDVGKNLNLSILGCTDNQLRELNVSQNANLEELWCGSNQITLLDVSKNPNLKTLYCSNNQITLLDVSKNTGLTQLRCSYNQLSNLDLSYNKSMLTRGDSAGVSFNGGAHVVPQIINTNIAIINGEWALDLAAIVGQENLSRVTLATSGAELSQDGIVTFSGSDMPTTLIYNYDTKNPAEDTPMTVNVALISKNIEDQTGEDVAVDTGDLDLDSICKNHNLNLSANIEIILSQDTPSKEDFDKLTQAAGANGYSITATYEILMSLFSNGQKIADITDNFGRLKLTFQVNASLAGQSAIVYQLHNNSQVIVHDGLTVNTDGTVTITVDKFSSFAVAVKQSSGNTGRPNTDQSGTNKPGTDKPDTNQPDTDKPDTNQPDTDKPDTNQPDTDRPGTDQPDTNGAGVNPSNTDQVAPLTGDSSNLVFWMIAVIMVSIVGILSRKRYHKN